MDSGHPGDRGTRLTTLILAASVVAVVVSIAMASFTYHLLVLDGRWALTSDWLRQASPEARSAALGQLGDYFGGTLNPILSFCGFLVLLVTVLLQRRQLEEGARQAARSTRAIDLEAFVRVNDILQTAEGIAARRRLYELTEEGPHHKPFEQWSTEDKQAAEVVCRQFELVGLLVEGRLFEPGLLLQSWGRTVVRCWGACEGVVRERRSRQGDKALWSHFQALAGLPCAASHLPDPHESNDSTKMSE